MRGSSSRMTTKIAPNQNDRGWIMEWNEEAISNLSLKEIENLRDNGLRHKADALVALCESEIAKRRSLKPKANEKAMRQNPRKGADVIEFDFVCDRDRGVTHNPDGTFWSGVWVVDQRHAERAAEIGAHLALHELKSQKSYLQGIVKGWRKVQRDRQYGDNPAKREEGIDFWVFPTNMPLGWVGTASGEKGYKWSGT